MPLPRVQDMRLLVQTSGFPTGDRNLLVDASPTLRPFWWKALPSNGAEVESMDRPDGRLSNRSFAGTSALTYPMSQGQSTGSPVRACLSGQLHSLPSGDLIQHSSSTLRKPTLRDDCDVPVGPAPTHLKPMSFTIDHKVPTRTLARATAITTPAR